MMEFCAVITHGTSYHSQIRSIAFTDMSATLMDLSRSHLIGRAPAHRERCTLLFYWSWSSRFNKESFFILDYLLLVDRYPRCPLLCHWCMRGIARTFGMLNT